MAITRGASIALIACSVALASCGSLNPLSRGDRAASAGTEQGIGVNGYLWRASLDTLSFMPLVTADPWGGVINYDWYTPAADAERALQGHGLHPGHPPARRRPERHGDQADPQRRRASGSPRRWPPRPKPISRTPS